MRPPSENRKSPLSVRLSILSCSTTCPDAHMFHTRDYDQLVELEEAAKTAAVGMWTKDQKTIEAAVRHIDIPTEEQIAELFEKIKGGPRAGFS